MANEKTPFLINSGKEAVLAGFVARAKKLLTTFLKVTVLMGVLVGIIYLIVNKLRAKNDDHSDGDKACQEFLQLPCNFTDDSHTSVVNYDPNHSMQFIKGQETQNIDLMEVSIVNDLKTLVALGYNEIKTFYSMYATKDAEQQLSIVELVHNNFPDQLKVNLGVYIYRPSDGCESSCADWTNAGMNAALNDIAQYPSVVESLIIGNEDWSSADVKSQIYDLAASAKKQFPRLPMGTAQIGGSVADFANDPDDPLWQELDFVGANIYPFWAGKSWGKDAKDYFWQQLFTIGSNLCEKTPGKAVWVTEAGWPADGDPRASLASHDEYLKWHEAGNPMDACPGLGGMVKQTLFQGFDKLDQGTEGSWGLRLASGEPKGSGSDINVLFENRLKDQALLLACEGTIANQPTCWPIHGSRLSSINVNAGKTFKLTLPFVFDFIWAFVHHAGVDPTPACVVPQNLQDGSRVAITWSSDGEGQDACGNSARQRPDRSSLSLSPDSIFVNASLVPAEDRNVQMNQNDLMWLIFPAAILMVWILSAIYQKFSHYNQGMITPKDNNIIVASEELNEEKNNITIRIITT